MHLIKDAKQRGICRITAFIYCWGKIFTSRDVEFHLFWHIVGGVLRKVFGERALSSAVDLVWDPPAWAGKATGCLEGLLSTWPQTLSSHTEQARFWSLLSHFPSPAFFYCFFSFSFFFSSIPFSTLKKKKFIYFIYLTVLALSWGMWTLSCSMWDPFPTKDWTLAPCMGAQSLSQWTTREVLPFLLKIFLFKDFFLMWTIFFKSLLNLLQHYFGFMFWVFGLKGCGILAPWPGIEPALPALGGEVLATIPSGKPLKIFIFLL